MAFKIPNFYKQMSSNSGPTKKAPKSMSPLNVSYDKAYDDLSDAEKAKYRKDDKAGEGKGRARFTEKAKAYNKKEYGTTEPTKAAEKGELTGDKAKKLIVEKMKAKKKREDVAKAKKDKPAETKTVKDDDSKKEIKVKTRKEKRSARRADRLKAKAKSKGSLTPGQKKRLERNEAKAKGEKPEKTKAGKVLKSVVDKAKDLVSKKDKEQK
tara:strand:- start:29 stop:658 length:630 start_codon:yes stop_codon:yes gene_type:complete